VGGVGEDSGGGGRHGDEHPVGDGRDEERRVEDVHDAAEARERFGVVLDAGVAFEDGGDEVAHLSDESEEESDEGGLPGGESGDGAGGLGGGVDGEGDECGECGAAGEPFPGFAGAEPGDEFVFTDGAAGGVGADVVGLGDEDDGEEVPAAELFSEEEEEAEEESEVDEHGESGGGGGDDALGGFVA